MISPVARNYLPSCYRQCLRPVYLLVSHFLAGCAAFSKPGLPEDAHVESLIHAVLENQGPDACLTRKSIALPDRQPSYFLEQGFSDVQAVAMAKDRSAQIAYRWKDILTEIPVGSGASCISFSYPIFVSMDTVAYLEMFSDFGTHTQLYRKMGSAWRFDQELSVIFH